MHRFSRAFLFFLAVVLAAATSRASDPISAPIGGQSQTVAQPHVTAELIPEKSIATAGGTIDVILHLHADPGWHTYWINPGDAGLATAIKWTLPPGWTAGPIQWPTPEVHMMGPLTTYGYAGDVYLISTLHVAAAATRAGPGGSIHAHATWLVCQEECIPGKADSEVKLSVVQPGQPLDMIFNDNSALFAAARARLPAVNQLYEVKKAYYGPRQEMNIANAPPALNLELTSKASQKPADSRSIRFFAEQPNVLASDLKTQSVLAGYPGGSIYLTVSLAQNGEKPERLSGVLVSDQSIQGEAKAVFVESFPVRERPMAAEATGTNQPSSSSADAAATNYSAQAVHEVARHTPTLVAVLAFAFLGGLILNLMPCVLPVLSLKVFSLIKHAGDEKGGAWKQGLAFTAGVLVSFWILAGLLIVLESAGRHLGWGFQMQSPGFVLALIFLFFLLGLNLFGVFELGTSLVGLDVKATAPLGGLASSFANGALATLAATPCTAPFMGSAVGFAAQQPAAVSLLVFTMLALGMAAPYLALTSFPGALRLVPRPGAWMETLKQFMGFLLLGTVIFLVYVFGALTGPDSVPMLLGALLVAAVGAWVFGRGTGPQRSFATRILSAWLAVVLVGAGLAEGVRLARAEPASAGRIAANVWQPWTEQGVQQALAQGRPVFVDFTAAWCLSCKVNEQVALEIDSTRQLFSQKRVALFRGDWTRSDPKISETLRRFNRDGVPLYLVYSPREPVTPQVLPEVLTPGLVQQALQNLP